MLLRIVNFTERGADPTARLRVGFLADDLVVDFARVAAACSKVHAACEEPAAWQCAVGVAGCEACLDAAQQYADWFAVQERSVQREWGLPLAETKLLPPVPNPGKLFCLAQNFPSHVAESSRHITYSGESAADAMTPHVFMKPSSNSVCGEGDPIVISRVAQFIDYEAEVAAIIGKRGKYIPAAEAAQYVAGVTAFNDVSERKLKVWERKQEREWDHFFDWLNGKWYDSFAPMGPALVPTRSVDLEDLTVKGYVNGELRQHGNTKEMFHSIAKTIEYISQMLTLEPGDVIAMGTPGGVGAAVGKKLMPGDVVAVELEGLMRLTNPVVAEDG